MSQDQATNEATETGSHFFQVGDSISLTYIEHPKWWQVWKRPITQTADKQKAPRGDHPAGLEERG